MTDDLNKTAVTKDVTAAAIVYLDERGCKPIETEVTVAPGWVADVASVVQPTATELIDLKLIERAPSWNYQIKVGLDPEGKNIYTSSPKRADWNARVAGMQQLMTVLVEVKTSRSDFCGDKKWAMQPPTNLAYLAIPKDLAIDGPPSGWGVLEVSESGCRLRTAPAIRSVTVEQQLAVVLQIAVRRDHDTRYERLRALNRRHREQVAESRSSTNVMKAMRLMESIIHGKHGSIKEAMFYHGVKLPEYYIEELEGLWAVVQKQSTMSENTSL
jgi:hypothetical protein